MAQQMRVCLSNASTSRVIHARAHACDADPAGWMNTRIGRDETGTNQRCAEIFRGPIAWLPLIAMVATSLAIRQSVPSWAFMWTMLIALVGGFKWLTLCRVACRLGHVPFGRAVAYLVAWPGMDGERFLDQRIKAKRPLPIEWLQAVGKLAIGIGLIRMSVSFLPFAQDLAAGWIGMIGLAFVLHFGLFHALALLWRSVGIDATHIFHSPVRAHAVANFWGCRWNLAFRDLAHSLLFRPLVSRVGLVAASLVTFALSGFVHELVISLPARAGYGLPTLYFLTQWCGLVIERSRLGRKIGLRRGLVGWLFTLAVVVGPLGLLFHSRFVVDVVMPFLRVL